MKNHNTPEYRAEKRNTFYSLGAIKKLIKEDAVAEGTSTSKIMNAIAEEHYRKAGRFDG